MNKRKVLSALVVLASLAVAIGTVQVFAGSEQPIMASPALLDEPQAEVVSQVNALKGIQLAGPTSLLGPSSGYLVVDDDGVECPTAGYTTIQAAVNAAALMAGSQEIHVCAGTYAENIVIGTGNSVEIMGDGTGLTNVTGVSGTAGPIIDVASAGIVDVSHLTVDGGSAMAGGVVTGIRYSETNGMISDVEVLNIRNASGSSQGVGIRVQSSGPTTHVMIKDSEVDNYTRVGINANGTGVELEVNDNSVTGPVLPRVWAPNGIQIARGAEGEVKHNVVDNNPSPNPPGGAGSGILLFCAGTTEVQNNTVSDADLGIALADNGGAHVHSNDISDSVFDAISLQFIGNFFGGSLGCPGHPVATAGNNVHSNHAVDSGDTGISLANFDPGTIANTPNGNSVRQNDVEDSANDGIHVFDGQGNEFKNNEIDGSGGTDAVDDTSGSGTAGTANTWKNNKCSTSSPVGLCK